MVLTNCPRLLITRQINNYTCSTCIMYSGIIQLPIGGAGGGGGGPPCEGTGGGGGISELIFIGGGRGLWTALLVFGVSIIVSSYSRLDLGGKLLLGILSEGLDGSFGGNGGREMVGLGKERGEESFRGRGGKNALEDACDLYPFFPEISLEGNSGTLSGEMGSFFGSEGTFSGSFGTFVVPLEGNGGRLASFEGSGRDGR